MISGYHTYHTDTSSLCKVTVSKDPQLSNPPELRGHQGSATPCAPHVINTLTATCNNTNNNNNNPSNCQNFCTTALHSCSNQLGDWSTAASLENQYPTLTSSRSYPDFVKVSDDCLGAQQLNFHSGDRYHSQAHFNRPELSVDISSTPDHTPAMLPHLLHINSKGDHGVSASLASYHRSHQVLAAAYNTQPSAPPSSYPYSHPYTHLCSPPTGPSYPHIQYPLDPAGVYSNAFVYSEDIQGHPYSGRLDILNASSSSCNSSTFKTEPSEGDRGDGTKKSDGKGTTGKPKRKRVASVAQRRAANIRERRRMYSLNESFDSLRKKVPTFAYEKRLSRIETLRLAITYISFMTDLVKGKAPSDIRLATARKNILSQMSEQHLLSSFVSAVTAQQQPSGPSGDGGLVRTYSSSASTSSDSSLVSSCMAAASIPPYRQ